MIRYAPNALMFEKSQASLGNFAHLLLFRDLLLVRPNKNEKRSNPDIGEAGGAAESKTPQDSGQCFGCGVRRDWKSRFPLVLRSEMRLARAAIKLNACLAYAVASSAER